MTGLLATRRTRRVSRLGHLRLCLPASAGAAVLAGGGTTLAAGPGPAAGVAGGVAVAAATFGVGAVVVDAADRVARSRLLYVGLGVYLATVLALGAALVRLAGTAGGPVAGLPWGVLLGIGVWLPAQCWWAWTSPTPYVEMLPPGRP